jgi:hypothetical protein
MGLDYYTLKGVKTLMKIINSHVESVKINDALDFIIQGTAPFLTVISVLGNSDSKLDFDSNEEDGLEFILPFNFSDMSKEARKVWLTTMGNLEAGYLQLQAMGFEEEAIDMLPWCQARTFTATGNVLSLLAENIEDGIDGLTEEEGAFFVDIMSRVKLALDHLAMSKLISRTPVMIKKVTITSNPFSIMDLRAFLNMFERSAFFSPSS